MPLLGSEIRLDQLSVKRGEFSHQLFLNGGAEMEVTEGYPVHPCLFQVSKEPFHFRFRVGQKGDDGIDPYLWRNPGLLQFLDISHAQLWGWGLGFIILPVLLRQGDESNLGEDLIRGSLEKAEESMGDYAFGQE